MSFQYIAIDGPTGVGKTALAERLAARLDAALVLEELDNPFLEDFYAGRQGAALHAQIFFLLGRHRQQLAFRQADLFTQTVVCDYLFDRDRIFAYLNLDDNELFVYQRLYELLARDMAPPDLVIYLQAPPEVLARRLRDRAAESETQPPVPSTRYLRELN
jgi:deoxyadenosine/deoxycytidine kinase